MSPELELRTLCELDARGRVLRNREPGLAPAARFKVMRSATGVAWGVRFDVPDTIEREVSALAASEPTIDDLAAPPTHAARYAELLPGRIDSGPCFLFPDDPPPSDGAVEVTADSLPGLARSLVGRLPAFAMVIDGRAVSVCSCARLSEEAAEAGLETDEAHRGKDYGPRVTAAWAAAIRNSGRTPFYSTAWTNTSSRRVAEKLGLIAYASDWSVQ